MVVDSKIEIFDELQALQDIFFQIYQKVNKD